MRPFVVSLRLFSFFLQEYETSFLSSTFIDEVIDDDVSEPDIEEDISDADYVEQATTSEGLRRNR